MYLGDEGHTICTLAFGGDVARIPIAAVSKLVDVKGSKPRIGQGGVLYWSEHTDVTVKLEHRHSDSRFIFPYNLEQGQTDLATRSFIQEFDPSVFVNLVMWVRNVQQKETNGKGEPFLVAYGSGVDEKPVGPLRLWRFEQRDMSTRAIYVITGLKVVAETVWSNEEYRWMPRPDGIQTIECTSRTAVEDVSHVPTFMEYTQS